MATGRAALEEELEANSTGKLNDSALSTVAKDLCMAHHAPRKALIALKLFDATMVGGPPCKLPGAPRALLHVRTPWAARGERLGFVILPEDSEEYRARVEKMLGRLGLTALGPWMPATHSEGLGAQVSISRAPGAP